MNDLIAALDMFSKRCNYHFNIYFVLITMFIC